MRHKEGPGKSMKNALYCMYSSIAKGTSRAEAMLNSKKNHETFVFFWISRDFCIN